jgi:hypothetical protein
MSEMTSNRRTIVAAFLLTLCYISLYYCLDSRQKVLREQSCEKGGSGFVFKPQEYLRLRAPAKIFFLFDRSIDRMKIEWKENRVVSPKRISDRCFFLGIEDDLHVARINLTTRTGTPGNLMLRIGRKPLIRVPLLLFQFAIAFLLAWFVVVMARWMLTCFNRKNGEDSDDSGWMFRTGVFLISLFFAYVLLHPAPYLQLFREWKTPLCRALGVNLGYAVFLVVLYFMLSRRPKARIALPFVFGLLILLLTPAFKLEVCGDAQEWLRIIRSVPVGFGRYDATTISFAESLSQLLGKALLAWMRPLFNRLGPAAVYIVLAKTMGIFYLIMLYRFVFGEDRFGHHQKLLFFLLAASLPAGAFFLGYPEFAYYALPFLLLSFILASRYLARPRSSHLLLLSAIAITVGGLFHGSAFFSLPALLILPFLKMKRFPEPRPVRFCLRGFLLVAAGVALPVLLLLAIVSLLGYRIVFYTALGGAVGGKFVWMLPTLPRHWNDKIFLDQGYLFLRGWIFLVGFPAPLVLFGFRRARRIQISPADSLFFLMAALQMLIVLFWGFDLNIKDFDLYMAPLTLASLFLMKIIVDSESDRESTARSLWLILIFTLASPVGLFLAMTAA